MKRVTLLVFVLCAFGQTTRDAYRTAYREWRTADPGLERDAATAGPEFSARTARAASAAAQYGSTRASFLRQMTSDEAQKLAWLETPPDAPSAMTLESASTLIAADIKAVKRTMDTFATDPDPGIRELRTKLAQESAAADALTAAMEKRKRAAEGVKTANGVVAESQLKAAAQVQTVDADSKQTLAQSDHEAAAWAQYYALLGNAARGIASAPTVSAPAPVPVISAPKPPVSTPPAVTPLPLIRYTGAWTFPLSAGLYHGAQPELVDLVVNEENGRATGTLFARFKVPPGSSGDPVLRFDFSGEFKSTRIQTFNLTTAEGAKGSIDLIPGPAFNLLEVNFQTDPKPGKVRQGNFVLVKK